MLIAPTTSKDEGVEENKSDFSSSSVGLRKLPFETYLELISCPLGSSNFFNEDILSDVNVCL